MPFTRKDAALRTSDALPAALATSYSTLIDLMNVHGDFLAGCEVLLEAPALTMLEQPDTQTTVYSIQSATDLAFTTPVDEFPACLTQTGADGAGAAAASFRCRLRTSVNRYFRVKIVGGDELDGGGEEDPVPGDNSAQNLTVTFYQ